MGVGREVRELLQWSRRKMVATKKQDAEECNGKKKSDILKRISMLSK